MNATHTTEAGTVVYEPTQEEYAAYLDRIVWDAMGRSVADFKQAYEDGELDETNTVVGDLIALLRIGQEGDSSSA